MMHYEYIHVEHKTKYKYRKSVSNLMKLILWYNNVLIYFNIE